MTDSELHYRLAAIESRLLGMGAAGSPGISAAFGASAVVYRDRFPARLTSTFDAATGYDWERLVLDRSTAPSAPTVATVSGPETGSYAFTPDNNEDLAVGQRGWLEADPNAGGWLFIPVSAASELTVEEADGSPQYTGINTLRFDQSDGFTVTNPATGVARIDFTGSGSVSAWKEPVRVATTANGTLASSFENGDSVDGVTLATGDRILIKNQTTATENGIYTVNASGAPTRATDADAGSELLGAIVVVTEGTENADSIWLCTNNSTITLGSTNLAFTLVFPSRQEEIATTSTYAISADGTWEDVTISSVLQEITLPEDGLYHLFAQANCVGATTGTISNNCTISIRIINSSSSSVLATARGSFTINSAMATAIGTATTLGYFQGVKGDKFKLQAFRTTPTGGGSWTTSTVGSTNMYCHRIGS